VISVSEEPFAILRIAPTLDAAVVKRAYFAALARHPPHQDPEGFRRLRGAYESLSRPGALAVAYLASPVDVQRLAAEARERFDGALEKAREAALAARAGAESMAQFQERYSRLRWEELDAQLASSGKRLL
jgi:hypothetical protein